MCSSKKNPSLDFFFLIKKIFKKRRKDEDGKRKGERKEVVIKASLFI